MIALILAGLLLGWDGYHLPDPRLTPGVTRPITKQEVCGTAWGLDRRHVSDKTKAEVYARYGATKRENVCCEIDHLVPRELGGADDIRNLWPQPWKEARLKDHLENFLHRAVCGGSMTLEAAQRGIQEDWTQEFRKMKAQE